MKAKLPLEVRTGDGSELATRDIFICPNCGACHEGEVERCHACDSPIAGEVPVKRTLRIDNVETACAYRKSNPSILMVQSTQNWATENESGCLGGA
jgi:hypothetical protein